jgi:hypothetical protein
MLAVVEECVQVVAPKEVKVELAAVETGLNTDTPVAIPRHQTRAVAAVVETAVVEPKTVALA